MRFIKPLAEKWELPKTTLKEALKHISEEVVEFIHKPSWDEFGDILWCVGRLSSDVFGIDLPLASDYLVAKIEPRFELWKRDREGSGCICRIRSRCKCGKYIIKKESP